MKKSLLVGLLILTSVCFVFGQSKNLDAETGIFIYLNGSETVMTEEEYLYYAISFETETYNKYKNDEFEWYDQFQKIKQNCDNAIANADFSSTYSIVTGLEFGDYDFEKGGFPVSIPEGTFFPLGKCSYSSSVNYYSVFRKEIALSIDSFSDYNFLPMEKDVAKAFLQGRKDRYGNVDRNITVQIKYKIASYDSEEYKDFADLAIPNNYLPIVGIIESITVYDFSDSNKAIELGTLTIN